jgi:signal transduction histidine kinase
VVAHAETGACGVEVRDDRARLAMRIWDRGRGFDPESMSSSLASHLGLAAMQERVEMAGGTWNLRSEPNAGTTIEAEFPRSSR